MSNFFKLIAKNDSLDKVKNREKRWCTLLYCSAIFIIIVLRIADLLITYHYTPDLIYEYNPIVAVLGASWRGYILSQIIILSFIMFMIRYYFFREKNIVSQPGLSFIDFLYFYFNGTLKPFRKRLSLFPKNLRRHLAFNGFLFMILSILVSLFAIVHNLLLVYSFQWYERLIFFHHKVIFAVLLGISIIGSSWIFFLFEYKNYKKCKDNSNG